MKDADHLISSALYPKEKDQLFEAIKSQANARLKEMEPGFVVDEIIEPVFRALSLYFSNHPAFEDEGFGKLSKGLFLSGNIGTGKTFLMSGFKEITLQNEEGWTQKKTIFILKSTNEMVRMYMLNGLEGLEAMLGDKSDGPSFINYCFDDLGSENTSAKYMGNEMNLMEEIILSRYEKKIGLRNTHFTSNLDADQIEKLYGTRVRSRLREMVNFIVIPGTDRRK